MSDPLQPNTDFSPEPGTLVIEDQSLRYGFVQLPKQVLWASNLSRDAKLLYAVLLGYAWQEASCFPGYDRLSLDMGATRKIVRKYMQELEGVGLIAQKRRGLGRTNLYRLPDLRLARLDIPERFNPTHPEGSKTTHQQIPSPEGSKTTQPVGSETPHADGSQSTRKVETVEEEPIEEDFEVSKFRKGSDDEESADGDGAGEDVSSSSSSRTPDTAEQSNGMTSLSESLTARYAGRGRPSREYSEDRQAILAFIQDFAREMNDQAPLQSSVTRALNLYRQSGLSRAAFVDKLYQARAITQERSATITTKTDDGKSFPRTRKMPYFFAILEDRLGLKEARAERT